MVREKSALCLWFKEGADDAARFYCDLFPDSAIHTVNLAPSDWPGGKKGDVQKAVDKATAAMNKVTALEAKFKRLEGS